MTIACDRYVIEVCKKHWRTFGLEDQGWINLTTPEIFPSPWASKICCLDQATDHIRLRCNQRHTCTKLFSGIEVMVFKLVLSLSKHAGTYLSKRIVKFAFSDWCCLLSIQLATYLQKNRKAFTEPRLEKQNSTRSKVSPFHTAWCNTSGTCSVSSFYFSNCKYV